MRDPGKLSLSLIATLCPRLSDSRRFISTASSQHIRLPAIIERIGSFVEQSDQILFNRYAPFGLQYLLSYFFPNHSVTGLKRGRRKFQTVVPN
jgi:hypothetical protein